MGIMSHGQLRYLARKSLMVKNLWFAEKLFKNAGDPLFIPEYYHTYYEKRTKLFNETSQKQRKCEDNILCHT